MTTILLVMLSTARITRLITHDRITLPLRERIVRGMGPDHWLSYWSNCPWCVSVYAGAGVSVAVWQWAGHDWLNMTLLALSASYATGVLSSRTED